MNEGQKYREFFFLFPRPIQGVRNAYVVRCEKGENWSTSGVGHREYRRRRYSEDEFLSPVFPYKYLLCASTFIIFSRISSRTPCINVARVNVGLFSNLLCKLERITMNEYREKRSVEKKKKAITYVSKLLLIRIFIASVKRMTVFFFFCSFGKTTVSLR